MRDKLYMRLALALANKAYLLGEIPVGAVMVAEDNVIAWGYNEKELRHDATAHAEILTLQRAALSSGRWRQEDATLYTTLEPCAMCAGAMVNARLGTLVYGAGDSKAGACGSVLDIVRHPALNHQVQVKPGILAEECGDLIKQFFAELRRAREDKADCKSSGTIV